YLSLRLLAKSVWGKGTVVHTICAIKPVTSGLTWQASKVVMTPLIPSVARTQFLERSHSIITITCNFLYPSNKICLLMVARY